MRCQLGLAQPLSAFWWDALTLDTNVASRWTIAMVDEGAWGIGWASHESSLGSDLGSDCDPVHIPNRARTISDSDSKSLPTPSNEKWKPI